MEIRIPRTATRRQAGDYAKILSKVNRNTGNGFGFEGAFVRPGSLIAESELFPAQQSSAVLLEHAGLDRNAQLDTPGYGRPRLPHLYILWRHNRIGWRELARASSYDATWSLDLGPIARRALEEEKPSVIPEAESERIWKLLEGELRALEAETLAFVVNTVHNQLASQLVYAGGRIYMRVRKKDPAAVSLGRRGGIKGGKAGGEARAKALTPKRRQEIARKAGLASAEAKAARKRPKAVR